MIDDVFVIYENSNKYFGSYDIAYYNSRRPGSDKTVYYVFTPTMQRCKRVGELEKLCRDYFDKNDCTYLDVFNKVIYKQLNLLKEV